MRYLPTGDVPAPTESHAFPIGDDQDVAEGSWGDQVCGLLAHLLRIKRAQLTALDKRDFKAFWYGHKRQYKKE